jgi:hypothetical protein
MSTLQISTALLVGIFALQHVIQRVVYIFTQFLWMAPPFKQARGQFFYYFFLLAISEPIGSALYFFWKTPPFYTYTTASFLLILSVFNYKDKWGKEIILINTLLFVLVIIFFQKYAFHTAALFHLFLLGYFMTLFLKKYFMRGVIYIYLLMLVMFEFATVLMFSLRFVRTNVNIAFSYFLSLFEIFICLFFIFYNFKDSPRVVSTG